MNAKILIVVMVLSAGTGFESSGIASRETAIKNERKEIHAANQGLQPERA
jgi:hypothetical protein